MAGALTSLSIHEHEHRQLCRPAEPVPVPAPPQRQPSNAQAPPPQYQYPQGGPAQARSVEGKQAVGGGARPVSSATSVGEDPYAAYTSASPTRDRFDQHQHEHEESEEEEDDEDDDRYAGRRVLKVRS